MHIYYFIPFSIVIGNYLKQYTIQILLTPILITASPLLTSSLYTPIHTPNITPTRLQLYVLSLPPHNSTPCPLSLITMPCPSSPPIPLNTTPNPIDWLQTSYPPQSLYKPPLTY